jgi:hypothetical protein
VRGRAVYIVQSLVAPVAENLLELLMMLDIARGAAALSALWLVLVLSYAVGFFSGLGEGRSPTAPRHRRAQHRARQSGQFSAQSGGFVELRLRPDGAGTDTVPILEDADWPLQVVVAVTSVQAKAIGSTAGMLHTERTSPYYPAWLETSESDLTAARRAIEDRDFAALAALRAEVASAAAP